jgi:hypothetical protein
MASVASIAASEVGRGSVPNNLQLSPDRPTLGYALTKGRNNELGGWSARLPGRSARAVGTVTDVSSTEIKVVWDDGGVSFFQLSGPVSLKNAREQ